MSYESFAAVYDIFMDEVDYDGWSACIVQKLQENGIRGGLVCELGCGTGNITERLADAGYDLIGIDASADMLAVAQKKELLRKHPELAEESAAAADTAGDPADTECQQEVGREQADRKDILYLLQDMREFELYGTVEAVVSICDCLNYISSEEELLQVFRLVNNYLDPGGLFLFDMNLPVFYEAIGDRTIAENRPEGSFIWENEYDPETGCNRYDLTLFLPDGSCSADTEVRYYKREETHREYAYAPETILRLLAEAGLVCESVEEAYTGQPVSAETERILVTAREVSKKK